MIDKQVIDFAEQNWEEQIMAINHQEICKLYLKNYDERKINLNDLDINTKLQDVFFYTGYLSSLPNFIIEQDFINYLAINDVYIEGDIINLGDLKPMPISIGLYDKGTNIFPKSVSKLISLFSLSIQNSNIVTIDASFEKLQNLTHLWFRSNAKLKTFPKGLEKCKKLKFVELFGCDKIDRIEIGMENAIKEMRIGSWSENYEIPQGFNQLTSLEILNIDNQKKVVDLSFLTDLPNLHELRVASIDRVNMGKISEAVFLKSLRVGSLACQGVNEIPACFEKLQNLETLRFMPQGALDIDQLISVMQSLRSLKELWLDNIILSKAELSKLRRRLKIKISNK
ncbi:MAG: hypothetical protein FWF52_09040 [Candidatus Azobacteroides sp.]|nr:hypothetical protein [Candidatus Azobacteroides sp.]